MTYYKPYVGSYSALDPGLAADYGELFTGYNLAHKNIGATTSVQTANQIAEVEARLKEGISTIEMGSTSAEVFEMIPRQHFKEMGQMAKLANADITVHGPVIDPAGFTDRGWNEQAREEAERQMLGVVEKAHMINPKGNIPITFHASAIPAEDWSTNLKFKPGEELHPKEMMVVVNKETGAISGLRREVIYTPEGKEIWTPEIRLDATNNTEWKNHLIEVQNMVKSGDEIMERAPPEALVILKGLQEKSIRPEQLTDEQKKIMHDFNDRFSRASLYFRDASTRFQTLYDWAHKYGKGYGNVQDKKTKDTLAGISKIWQDEEKRVEKEGGYKDPIQYGIRRKEVLDNSFNMISQIAPPKIHAPVSEFAKDEASKTVGNVAWQAYKEFKETAPIIAVENILPNMAFSRADSLIDLIKASRKQFIKNATDSGMSFDRADKEAKKLIGATWDTAHISMLRKKGFEEKEIIEETKKIAPYVKKVHLTDNFGMEHADLPPGMGNVPIKKMMDEIKKAGFDGKSIVEAGQFVAQFKISPHPYVLEAMGSPIYGPAAGPVWGQAIGTYGEAGMGYGPIFPEQHFSMYGAGFSSLPLSMGGQVPGKQSRFSGAPME